MAKHWELFNKQCFVLVLAIVVNLYQFPATHTFNTIHRCSIWTGLRLKAELTLEKTYSKPENIWIQNVVVITKWPIDIYFTLSFFFTSSFLVEGRRSAGTSKTFRWFAFSTSFQCNYRMILLCLFSHTVWTFSNLFKEWSVTIFS